MQLAFGLLRFGRFIELVPVPVVSGFMSGIGVIIILMQLPPLLGFEAQAGPLASAAALPAAWGSLNGHAVMLGLVAIVIVYLMPRAWGGDPVAAAGVDRRYAGRDAGFPAGQLADPR